MPVTLSSNIRVCSLAATRPLNIRPMKLLDNPVTLARSEYVPFACTPVRPLLPNNTSRLFVVNASCPRALHMARASDSSIFAIGLKSPNTIHPLVGEIIAQTVGTCRDTIEAEESGLRLSKETGMGQGLK